MLTSTQNLPGAAGFAHADPLAQLSKVFYDRLDRFQLSRVCARLGLKHKAGEKHEVLVRLIGMRIEMRNTSNASVQEACRAILKEDADKIELSRGPIESDDLDEPVSAVSAPPAPTSDEVLEFAVLTVAEKRQALKEMGVRFTPQDNGKALLALWRGVKGL